MNLTEQEEFRRRLGAMVITEQNIAAKRGDKPGDVVPVIIAALLSLATYISKHNTGLSQQEFIRAATEAAQELWEAER